jgi:hypothetical protein
MTPTGSQPGRARCPPRHSHRYSITSSARATRITPEAPFFAGPLCEPGEASGPQDERLISGTDGCPKLDTTGASFPGADFRHGSKAVLSAFLNDVRFTPTTDIIERERQVR